MFWHQIQAAKKKGGDLRVIFLDLANAFGLVLHNLLCFFVFQDPR